VPRRPKQAKPDTLNYVAFKVPGALKNEMRAFCTKKKMTMSSWLIELAKTAMREDRGIPEPPPARAPIPTAEDEIRAYMLGEKVMTPCGKSQDECLVGVKDSLHSGMKFCVCGIRVE
jgi:hypothetical protein